MKIFVVDDERIVRISLVDELVELKHEVYEFAHAGSALSQIQNLQPEIVISDIKMPDIDGITFLKKIKELNNNIYVILMTGYSTVSSAVEAMKLGAYEYIEKPFPNQKMINLINHISEIKEIRQENVELKSRLKQEYSFDSYVGNSRYVAEIFHLVKLVAQKSTSVLIVGETGTRKELLTNIIHFNSLRKNKPLVKVSCAILSKELFESELFGHVKGAFTGATSDKKGRFELAEGGTIYLDDIDDVPLELQVKLLRALQEHEIERVGDTKTKKIDVRLIASTKKDLRKMVDEGKFREDLFYRLNVFPINLPPLRDRVDDIETLTKYFVSQYEGAQHKKIDTTVLDILKKYPFPGNIRELKNLVERLIILSEDGNITKDIIPFEITYPKKKVNVSSIDANLNELVADFEKNMILETLDKCNNNKTKTAEKLGIPVTTLKSKINKYGL